MRQKIATVLLVALVALAGCTGGGGGDASPGNDGDENGNGDGLGTGTYQPFAFDQPGTWEYDVFVDGSGEGTMTIDITKAAEDQIAATVTYDVGGQVQETTVSGAPETIQQQLLRSGAGAAVFTTMATSGAAFTGQQLSAGTEWSYSQDGQTVSYEVTGTDSYAGQQCYATEVRSNDALAFENCVAPDMGLALYSAAYDVDGNVVMQVELTSYQAA